MRGGMMVTNASLTIYNRKLNPETKMYTWSRTVLTAVWWYTDQKVQMLAGDKGLSSADLYKIRIPKEHFSEGYLSPEEYAALSYGKHKQYWTVENGDLFAKGTVMDEIEKESDLKNKRYLTGKVLSHSENFFGRNPHIRIGGA